jgi:proline iminopeptidase
MKVKGYVFSNGGDYLFLEMSDKIKIFVNEAGKGMACVFIHGGPGAWSYEFETFCGDNLESTMKMVYLDQRGCGRSEGDHNSDYSIGRMVEDIEEVRKKLNITKWIVLAHSFGGIIALNYVHKYGSYVEGLILANCTLNMKDSLESQIEYGSKLLNQGELQKKSNETIMERWQKSFTSLIEKDIFYKLQYNDYNNYLKVNEISSSMENTSMAQQAFDNEEYFSSFYSLTKEIIIPVLVIAGDEDYAIGCDHYKKLMFPKSKTEIIKGKHVLYLESRESFIKTINRFINCLSS